MHQRTSFVKLLLLGLGGIAVAGGVAAGIGREPSSPPPLFAPVAEPPPPAPNPEALRQATSLSDAFIAIAETVTPSVVRIQAERGVPARRRGTWLQGLFGDIDSLAAPVPELAGGTGFVITSDGYILTNDHVVDGADRVLVGLRDKRVFEATIVGRDPSTDLAVIRIPVTGAPALELGDSEHARVGEWVLAIGNPGFDNAHTLDFTVTSGIISAKGRPLNVIGGAFDDANDGFAIEDFIQTDAVINPGNSGGPLVNLRGAVIGVNTAIATSTGFNQGYGFAIPSNLARRVARDLIERGHVRRALLGVSIVDATPEDAEVYGLARIAGVVVEDFAAGSPAERAGLERHDVIIALDGVPVERTGQLQRLVALREPGETVTLDFVRYGEAGQAQIRLGQAPLAQPATPPNSPRPVGGVLERLGLRLGELTPTLARQLGFGRSGGAIVEDITELSPADRKRIGIGHRVIAIDRRAVANAREASAALRGARPGQVVSLVLETPDGRTYIANMRVP
jgi:serine protease Do